MQNKESFGFHKKRHNTFVGFLCAISQFYVCICKTHKRKESLKNTIHLILIVSMSLIINMIHLICKIKLRMKFQKANQMTVCDVEFPHKLQPFIVIGRYTISLFCFVMFLMKKCNFQTKKKLHFMTQMTHRKFSHFPLKTFSQRSKTSIPYSLP